MDAYRVWADIDLDALAHNLAHIRSRTGPGVALMLVVKADAYGHGAVAIAHRAVRAGVDALGVGTSAEALELRETGLMAPILVLGTVVDEEVAPLLRHGVQIGLHSFDRLKMLQSTALRIGTRARVHLNIDTGMGRLGVMPSKALELLERIHAASQVELGGVMTHLTAIEGMPSEATESQLQCFEKVLQGARERHLPTGLVHVANSAHIFTGQRPIYDMVRAGISAYGILPGHLSRRTEQEAVLALRSQIVFIKDFPAGASVGYGSTWRATRPTRLATLPLGYNDGVPWRVSNCGEVLLRGRRAPIVGRVSMDYTTVDATDIPGATVGDTATLIGVDADQEIRAEDVAKWAGSIPYEITCSLGDRVRRIYHSSEESGRLDPGTLAPARATRAARPGSSSQPAAGGPKSHAAADVEWKPQAPAGRGSGREDSLEQAPKASGQGEAADARYPG